MSAAQPPHPAPQTDDQNRLSSRAAASTTSSARPRLCFRLLPLRLRLLLTPLSPTLLACSRGVCQAGTSRGARTCAGSAYYNGAAIFLTVVLLGFLILFCRVYYEFNVPPPPPPPKRS
eukprot:2860102-Rhodomonas_salina.1